MMTGANKNSNNSAFTSKHSIFATATQAAIIQANIKQVQHGVKQKVAHHTGHSKAEPSPSLSAMSRRHGTTHTGTSRATRSMTPTLRSTPFVPNLTAQSSREAVYLQMSKAKYVMTVTTTMARWIITRRLVVSESSVGPRKFPARACHRSKSEAKSPRLLLKVCQSTVKVRALSETTSIVHKLIRRHVPSDWHCNTPDTESGLEG